MRALVASMRRFALDDGPGIRTTVFLKGCPLACIWCHNPEAISGASQLAFQPERCVGCGDCARACPAVAANPLGGQHQQDERERCLGCGRCAEVCPSRARRLVGEEMTPEGLAELLLRDRVFYETSGGGVTFSGGEPTLQLECVAAVARRLRAEGVHVALQTCGEFDLERFRTVLLPHLDLIQYDLKLADPDAHRRYTQRDNARILRNFRWLAREASSRLVARVPLVPDVTATRDNLEAIAEIARASECEAYALLPYNPGAGAKRIAIGERPHRDLCDRPLPRAAEAMAARWFAQAFTRGRRTSAGASAAASVSSTQPLPQGGRP